MRARREISVDFVQFTADAHVVDTVAVAASPRRTIRATRISRELTLVSWTLAQLLLVIIMAPTLLLIDVQRNMLLPPNPVPSASTVRPAIAAILDRARSAGATIVHVRNNGDAKVGDPDVHGTWGWELVHDVREGEIVIDKTTCDSFEGTGLAGRIPPDAPLVLVGMQSEFCITTTAKEAVRRGYKVEVVRGAHATYPGKEETAEDISARVERELAKERVTLVESSEVHFD